LRKLNKIKIFLADEIHGKGISILKTKGFEIINCSCLTNEKLLRFISHAQSTFPSGLIIRSGRTIDRYFIDQIKNTGLKLICTASSGSDNIDVLYSLRKGIAVLNVPYGNFVSTAEHTFAIILAITKNIIDAHKKMKEGRFEPSFGNVELFGKAIGIIGVGRVGSYVARLARSFNMKILGNDIDKSLIKKHKWIKFVPLRELIKSSDIVTLHTPLDSSTLNLLNKANMRYMKRNAILVNCARGGIVNERDLIDYLKNKRLQYAGIDVFENEPEINPRFRSLQKAVLTPHMAGKTAESRERISVQLAERIALFFRKKSKSYRIN